MTQSQSLVSYHPYVLVEHVPLLLHEGWYLCGVIVCYIKY